LHKYRFEIFVMKTDNLHCLALLLCAFVENLLHRCRIFYDDRLRHLHKFKLSLWTTAIFLFRNHIIPFWEQDKILHFFRVEKRHLKNLALLCTQGGLYNFAKYKRGVF